MPDNRELLALLDSIERALDEVDDPADEDLMPPAIAVTLPQAPRAAAGRHAAPRAEPLVATPRASVVRLHPAIADVGLTSAPRHDRDPPRTGVVPTRLTTRAFVARWGRD